MLDSTSPESDSMQHYAEDGSEEERWIERRIGKATHGDPGECFTGPKLKKWQVRLVKKGGNQYTFKKHRQKTMTEPHMGVTTGPVVN